MSGRNSSKTPFQEAIEKIPNILLIVSGIGTISGAISDSIGLINFDTAVILTSIITLAGLILFFWAKYKGIKWINNGTPLIVKKIPFYIWRSFIVIMLCIWLGPFINYFKNKEVASVAIQNSYKLNCNFPKNYNRDTLYILVTRFESDVNKVETKCFGRALRDRIEAKSSQYRIPIKICYSDSLYPQTHSEAKQFQLKYYADIVLWGDISNVEKDCSLGDFCFYSQPSDSLVQTVGGQIEVETDIIKYQKGIDPEKIREGEFNIKFSIKDHNFDKWLLTIYNIKIGNTHPDLFVIENNLSKTETSELHLQRGNLYCQLNRYEKALLDYEKAVQLDPNYGLIYNSRGVVRSTLGSHKQAIIDFDKAIQLNPNTSYVFYNRGIAKSALGDKKGAVQDFDKAAKLNPYNVLIYNNRGIAKSESGDKRGAVQDFDKAIQLNTNDEFGYINRGIAKSALGDKKGAVQDFNIAIQLNSKRATTYYSRGINKSALGNKQDAILDFNKAIRLNPNYVDAYVGSGNAKTALGDTVGAKNDYNKAIQLNPTSASANYNIGVAKLRSGNNKEAIKNFDRAIQYDAKLALAYYSRGSAKSALGNKKGAIQDFNKAIQLNPNDEYSYNDRGNAKGALGDEQSAIKDYDKAIQLNPNNPLPW